MENVLPFSTLYSRPPVRRTGARSISFYIYPFIYIYIYIRIYIKGYRPGSGSSKGRHRYPLDKSLSDV